MTINKYILTNLTVKVKQLHTKKKLIILHLMTLCHRIFRIPFNMEIKPLIFLTVIMNLFDFLW